MADRASGRSLEDAEIARAGNRGVAFADRSRRERKGIGNMIGDHIRTRKDGRWSHAIDCGDQTVMFLSEDPALPPGSRIQRAYRPDFVAGADAVEVVIHRERVYPPRQVVARAFSRARDMAAAAAFRTSAEFAAWCKVGRAGMTLEEAAAVVALPGAPVARERKPAPARARPKAAPARKPAAKAKPAAKPVRPAARKPAAKKAAQKKPAPKRTKAAKKPAPKPSRKPAARKVAPKQAAKGAHRAAARSAPKRKTRGRR